MSISTGVSSGAPPATCSACVFERGYGLLVRAASWLQSPLLLAMRLYWGWQFFGTGKGKLLNHEKVAEYFQSLHIPFASISAYLAGGTECFGGLLLLVGLGTRLACLPLIFVLTMAYLTAEIDSVKNIFSDPDKFTGATPFLFLMACATVLAFGPGKLSTDWLLEKRTLGRGKKTEA